MGVSGYVLFGGDYIGDFPSAGFHWLKSIQTNTCEYLYDIKTHRKVPSFSKLPGERQKLRSFWVMVKLVPAEWPCRMAPEQIPGSLYACFSLVCLDTWEVPFEEISELQWLGSGAQGAVFLGKFRAEEVAIKKVREQNETDIKHLRTLKHPNIIAFK